MTPERYQELRQAVIAAGFADEIRWSETVNLPTSPADFALEAAFVICNSGMKATIARPIFEKVRNALLSRRSARTAFGHPGKANAIDAIWQQRFELFYEFIRADDKVAWCETLPWIGPITKYHLAKNFGVDCAKPDRHLVRIAGETGETPHELCVRLAAVTGDRIATVDMVIWRAAERGMV